MISDSNGETHFAHKLLLPGRQISSFCKAFLNNSSVNIKISKSELSKVVQSWGLEIDTKNCTYYFFDDIINTKNLDSKIGSKIFDSTANTYYII